MASLLELRPSLELTLFFVTFVAIGLLTLIAVNLHARLTRLEQSNRSSVAPSAYGHLVGRSLRHVGAKPPEIVLVLSARCRSCERILGELGEGRWTRSTAIVWKDGVPAAGIDVPDHVPVFPDGARLSAELGIGVTPFALELDPSGTVTKAGPITSLANLGWEPGVRFAAARRRS